MKNSDLTVQMLNAHNQITKLQNQYSEVSLQLGRTGAELVAMRRVLRSYELARQSICAAHPELLPEWDQAISEALRRIREEQER